MKTFRNLPGALEASQRALRARRGQGGYVLLMVFIFLLILGMVVGYLMVGTLTTEKEVGITSDQDLAMQNAQLALRDAQLDILGRLNDNNYAMNPDGTRPTTGMVADDARPDYTRPSFCEPNFWTKWGSLVYLYEPQPNDPEGQCTAKLDNGGGPDVFRGTCSSLSGTPDDSCTIGGLFRSQITTQIGMYISGEGSLRQCAGQAPWELADWGDDFGPAGPGCAGQNVPSVVYGTYTGAKFDTSNNVPPPRYIIEVLSPGATGLAQVDASQQGSHITKDMVLFRITAVGFGASTSSDDSGRHLHVMVQEVVAP